MDRNSDLIKINNLTFSYGNKPLFSDLRFNLCRGEKVALTGANGSGKTTLLHMIVGLIKPTSGNITVLGQPRKVEEDFREVRRKIGFQFQDADDQLFCPTVAEDIAFGPLNLGVSREKALNKTKELLIDVGLEGYEDRVIHHLSEGEKKLVSLATVLALEPEVLLLDEPTAGLDETSLKRTVALLDSLSTAMIIVSHDFNFLTKITSKTYRLENQTLNQTAI